MVHGVWRDFVRTIHPNDLGQHHHRKSGIQAQLDLNFDSNHDRCAGWAGAAKNIG